VEFTLYHPFAPFLNYLTDSCAMIVPPAAYQGGEFNPIGSGPFVFSSWTRGKSLILTRNPGYWGPHSSLEKIVFTAQPNPMWRILQIKNGIADIITLQSEKEYEELLGRNDILKLPLHSFSTYALSFNCRKKIFDRADVRRAFTHLLDKPVLVRQIFQEFAVPAVTLLPKQLFGFNDRLAEPGFDIEKARQLLAKAGLAGGFACKVFFADGNPGVEELINRLVLNARQVKVRITKVRLPFRRLQEAANRGEHDLLCVGWTGTPDPDYYLMPLLTLGKGNSNRSFYQNPELDAILRRARETIDPGKRKALYFRAQEIVYREVPLIPLFHLREIVATQPRVQNVFIDPADHLIFREAFKEGSGK
ncbi:MAG TPA: ABC transporter substrate-binding protein, partial [Candidatus Aminicenantes bacterium]|nr:ABC transporter substrate-binding protein [Candidatus Aminicenantes bacterium]